MVETAEYGIDEVVDYALLVGFCRGISPDPILTVSEWADEFRILPPTVAEPGKFRTSRTPYLREIMDKLSVVNPAQKVIFKKCSQIGATESGNNWLGYVIDIAPCVMLYVMPTDAMMKKTSKTRIKPMIDESARLSKKIRPSGSKEGGNTILEKEFEGGMVSMVGANSPVGLSSTPVRAVYLDECDRYPHNVGGEGDVISLAETRTATYGSRKKIFISSTPTLKGASIIDTEFEKTGQRYFMVPCPHCSTLIALQFPQLKWEQGKYDEVYYECQECGDKITERYKTVMLQNGEWQPLFPDKEDGITFGYHLNALYSPSGWYSWAQMAKEHDDAVGNLPKKVVFTNTKLGEVYEAEGDSPAWENLYNRREPFKINIPNEKVVLITAGVDVQKDRLEMEIVGWAKGKESWSIDYRVILGPTDNLDSPVWAELDKALNETFAREDGAGLQIKYLAIDSGYNTSTVYEYTRRHVGRVFPIKGQDDQVMMVSPPRAVETTASGKKINGIKVWNIGTNMIKTELYGWLMQERKLDNTYPPGYCHYPEYDRFFFRSLTAEKLGKTINKKGFTVYTWVKHYERNEVLDIRVYARAAANVAGMDRWSEAAWDKLYNDTLDQIELPTPKTVNKPKKKNDDNDFWKRH